MISSVKSAELIMDVPTFSRGLKANTRKTRVLNLLRIGYHFIRDRGDHINYAVAALYQLLYLQKAPNWG